MDLTLLFLLLMLQLKQLLIGQKQYSFTFSTGIQVERCANISMIFPKLDFDKAK